MLAGDISAEAWLKTLLQDELPAQAYGRLLLLPGAKAPVVLQSRGKPVCNCLNVTDVAIDAALTLIREGATESEAEAAAQGLDTQTRGLAALQEALGCGTQCGSCVPELKRRVRAAWPAATGRIIPIHAAA